MREREDRREEVQKENDKMTLLFIDTGKKLINYSKTKNC